ncbi:MAG: hypothetical protein KDA71_11380, partial [Planctomycetales bacterium]|nr:hypothetical protein [Planctomycetales bacterium]
AAEHSRCGSLGGERLGNAPIQCGRNRDASSALIHIFGQPILTNGSRDDAEGRSRGAQRVD